MATEDIRRYRDNLRDELDGAALYTAIAAAEPDPLRKDLFLQLAQAETRHAELWRGKLAAAGMVIVVNLLLRPLVQRINRQPLATAEAPSRYVVNVVCRGDTEAHVRALLLQGLGAGGIRLHRLDSSNIEDSDRVEVLAEVSADRASDSVLEQIVGRLSLEPSVTAARWRVEPSIE